MTTIRSSAAQPVVCAGPRRRLSQRLSPDEHGFVDDLPAAIIDFDTLRPGQRLWDLGYSAFTWLDLGNDDHSPAEQVRRLSIFAAGYDHAACTTSSIAAYALARQTALAASARRSGKLAIADWAASCACWTALNVVERLLTTGYFQASALPSSFASAVA